jgi:FAD/FMN-containing dehydrogenase/Fe-S oxidoreductase
MTDAHRFSGSAEHGEATDRKGPRRRVSTGHAQGVNAKALARDLALRIAGEVRFDAGSRALYATDASNYREVPIGVVVPRSVEDVVHAVAVCRNHGAPVLARGGGTSLAGQCCNVAVVVDVSKHLRGIVDLDPSERYAIVEPGCNPDDLRDMAERHGLTFGPDPSTHGQNTIGGMIGNNSCGVHSVMAGRTADNVEALEVLTYRGERFWVGATRDAELAEIERGGGTRAELYRRLNAIRDRHADRIRECYPRIPRRVSGFNLDELLPENGFHVARALVGSEGTCAIVLRAKLRLVPSPPGRALLILGYPSVYEAADHVPSVMAHGPIGLEGMDDVLVEYMARKDMHPRSRERLPEGKGWLLAEFGGETREAARETAARAMQALGGEGGTTMELLESPDAIRDAWQVRESGLGATAHVSGERTTVEGWEDAAVPPDRLGDYLREFRRLLDRYDYQGSLYGHFGDGCVHTRITFDLRTERGVTTWRRFLGEAADLVLRYGGSLSGEHGDGQARAELLPKMFGDDLIDAMRTFKQAWDPDWKLNPGKVVEADPVHRNLRHGPGFERIPVTTVFAYPRSGHSFEEGTMGCVGVGKCRQVGHHSRQVMCPSYMGTHEEMHSTRGRARLLEEMLRGINDPDAPLQGGWRSKAVEEALDLCLACKGCKSDCPVNVDMATYKAEFRYHHYRRRLRPRSAYAMGLIYWWSCVASFAPRAVNFSLHQEPIASILKRIANVAPERDLPVYARQTFRDWFVRSHDGPCDGDPVILWPDTFNNYFDPPVLRAAVQVLERAGCTVRIPVQSLCCGRPLFFEGMLDLARYQLRRIIDVLEPDIAAGRPIVGLEPACVATFRDELCRLFPDDPRARSLSRQTFSLGEFLDKRDFQPRALSGRALLHVHCNAHAVLEPEADRAVLARTGLDCERLRAGCCGMAGSFGYETKKYGLSRRIGEQSLLPQVRDAHDAMIVADGFSCREQIRHGTGRAPLHLAQVLAHFAG